MLFSVLIPGFYTFYVIPVFFIVFAPAILGPLFCINIGGRPAPTPITPVPTPMTPLPTPVPTPMTPERPEVLSSCFFPSFFFFLSPRGCSPPSLALSENLLYDCEFWLIESFGLCEIMYAPPLLEGFF